MEKEISMQQEINKRSKGLNSFQLKVIALVLMVLDHIYYFFGFTEQVPVLFSQLGRISGYIFLFIVLEGFQHTRSRKKYIGRMYGLSVLMGCINYSIVSFGFARPDGFYPINNIFATFTLVLVVISGIEGLKQKQWLKGLGCLAVAIVPNGLAYLVPMHMMPVLGLVMTTVLPLPMFVEGGIFYVIAGILLYVLRKCKAVQMTVFGVFTLTWTIGMPYLMGMELSVSSLIHMYYEWMGIFAIPFMCLYNGEKGRSMKGFFYSFYPLHVYGFYILSVLFYHMIK
ncbi:MAG: TraX family protein [Niameybacter sp.]|uniref:TraX family protein n=1 Tax=Niameybacter sp. TaxID=2033640 RepID=UPI002FC98EB5